MNAQRTLRPFSNATRALVVLLAALSLVFGSVAATSAQELSALAVSNQFISSIEAGTSLPLLSRNAVLHTPEGDFVGRSGPAEFGQVLAGSFTNLDFATHSAVEIPGGLVLVSFTLTGVNTGSYRGVEANCAGFAVPGVALLSVERRTIVSPSWLETAREQRTDLPVYEDVDMVVEQWIDYDGDLLASQIAAFNAIDANLRPGCANHVIELPEPEGAPASPQRPAHVNELPW